MNHTNILDNIFKHIDIINGLISKPLSLPDQEIVEMKCVLIQRAFLLDQKNKARHNNNKIVRWLDELKNDMTEPNKETNKHFKKIYKLTTEFYLPKLCPITSLFSKNQQPTHQGEELSDRPLGKFEP